MDPYEIIFHPYVTEKTMNMMEKNNALEFVVKRKANKTRVNSTLFTWYLLGKRLKTTIAS